MNTLKRLAISAARIGLLLGLSLPCAFAQTGQISGIVVDASGGLIPGVSIKLTNIGTAVTSTQITNESGVYTFPSVPAGTYSVTASLPGFKTSVTNGVQVTLAPLRVNVTLLVGTLESTVEVSVALDTVSETAASVGTLLTERRVADLPMVGQNVLDLLTVLPGFREVPGNDAQSTVGGLALDYVNTTINGLSTVSSRDAASTWGRQVMTTNVINPELVGEIRLILSPVDAELGRGNSQVQIQTRSGTNKYSGSAVWDVQNTSLNANTWANKRTPTPTQPDWFNLNQVTGSYGGPIIRNKTFFYALVDLQRVNRRTLVTTPVLTDPARQGIWRYWEGWNPGPALAPQPTTFVAATAQPTGTAPAVDFNGNSIRPLYNPTGGPYTLSGLRCFSVFGNVKVDGSAFTQADCPGGTASINGSPWDSLRQTMDTTGYIRKILALMPHANFFGSEVTSGNPDGLNTAQYRYLQGRSGANSANMGLGPNSAIGVVQSTNDYNNRNQFNLKIDHQIHQNHRVSVSWTYEKDAGETNLAAWDGVLNGTSSRRPQFVTVNATSTISNTIVNEARFGLNYSSEFASPSWANIDSSKTRDAAQQFILYGGTNTQNGKKYPVLYNPGTNWNGFLNFGSYDFANYSPLYDYADTIRWTQGRHSFAVGGEYRRPSTVGYNNSAYIGVNPGNAGNTATPLFFTNANVTNGAASLPGFLATARNNAGTLLSTLYGAINAPNTGFWIDGFSDLKDGKWQDVTTAKNRIVSADPYGHQTRSQIQNEWNFFAKDDYKLSRRLTLNLGVRYDFTGSPYLWPGLTNRIDGDGYGLFGASRSSIGADPFADWLTPGNLYLTGYGTNVANPLQCVQGTANPNGIPAATCNPDLTSRVIYVGPGTDHPDQTLVPEFGRFSPAVGFSWQVPWFGEGKTTVRGGFQRTYGQAGSYFNGGLLSGPGADGTTSGVNTSDPRWVNIFQQRAANLTDVALAVPATPTRLPSERVFPIHSRGISVGYSHYDPNYRSAYTDNITLTIQRDLRRNMNLEVRAVNTLGRNQPGSGGSLQSAGAFNINTVNVYHNPELFEALEITRAGGNSVLLDQMLMGMNLNTTVTGYGAVGTCVTQPTGTADPRLGVGCGANQILQRGSAQLRRSTTFSTNLANGNYAAVINSLLTAGTTGTGGLQNLPNDPATGQTLVTSQRALRNGCDRLANGLTGGFTAPESGSQILPKCFSENYLIANPQFSTANYAKNLGYSNYNSIEVQFTMRPTHGLSFLATYGYSKQMQQPGNGFTDPLNPSWDYRKANGGSDFRSNGTLELPFGPNKLLLGNSSGWLARAVERWQMSFIYSITAGAPRTMLTGSNMLYANGRPDIVGPWSNPKGSVHWDGQNGQFFKETYATYQDPQCQSVTTLDNLQTSCDLRGLALVVPGGTAGSVALSSGQFGIPLLQNPKPGHQGNLGATTMNTFGRWALDANLSKTFQIRESKTLQVRIDARNIMNHPTPSDPTGFTSFNDNFGQITNKTGSRTFQAKLRLGF